MTSIMNRMSTMSDTVSRRTRGGGYVLLETDSELERQGSEQLLERVEALRKEVAYTKLENDLFERYLEKNDPELLLGITKMMSKTIKKTKITFDIRSSISGNDDTTTVRSADRSRSVKDDVSSVNTAKTFGSMSHSRTSSIGGVRIEVRINYRFRADMCAKDTDMYQEEFQHMRHVTKQHLRQMVALNESLRMDCDESAKTIAELHNFIHVTGKRVFGKDVPLEHLLSFVDTWVNNGNAIIEQMRLRTTTLRLSKNLKLKQLAIKKEMSGILRPIDFEQLQIEKVQLQRELDDLHLQFNGLKRCAGDVKQVTVTRKNELEKLESKIERFNAMLHHRREEIENYEQLYDKVLIERDDWERDLEKLKMRNMTHIVPSLEKYIYSIKTNRELDKECSVLKRKINISRIQLKGHRSQLAKLKKHYAQAESKRAASTARFDAIRDAVVAKP